MPELNGYVSIAGGLGSAKSAFVGIDTLGNITTFYLRPVSILEVKAPSLGWSVQPSNSLTDTLGPNPQYGYVSPYRSAQ